MSLGLSTTHSVCVECLYLATLFPCVSGHKHAHACSLYWTYYFHYLRHFFTSLEVRPYESHACFPTHSSICYIRLLRGSSMSASISLWQISSCWIAFNFSVRNEACVWVLWPRAERSVFVVLGERRTGLGSVKTATPHRNGRGKACATAACAMESWNHRWSERWICPARTTSP